MCIVFRFLCFLLLILSVQFTLADSVPRANAPSIYEASINGSDYVQRENLLVTVPVWPQAFIQEMFKIYHSSAPLHNNLQQLQYNVKFINSYFGVLNNPFMQHRRPSKLLLFYRPKLNGLDKNSVVDDYYSGLLIQQAENKRYYVFDYQKTAPVLFEDWLAKRIAHVKHGAVKISVCNKYGSLPQESCDETSYQRETEFAISSFNFNRIYLKSKNISARRDLHHDWYTYATQYLSAHKLGDIFDTRVRWQDANARQDLLADVTKWPNAQTIAINFNHLRDLRYFDDEYEHGFLRRISWLFPDDGCWTRTTSMIKDFFGKFNNPVSLYERPTRIFVFGNLCVNTDNIRDGAVAWWYHTTPVIRDAQTHLVYVLDPAVYPRSPLLIQDWLKLITSRSGPCKDEGSTNITFAICNGYASSPSENCMQAKFEDEAAYSLGQEQYRGYERDRQIALKRDIHQVLGDAPPWIENVMVANTN